MVNEIGFRARWQVDKFCVLFIAKGYLFSLLRQFDFVPTKEFFSKRLWDAQGLFTLLREGQWEMKWDFDGCCWIGMKRV